MLGGFGLKMGGEIAPVHLPENAKCQRGKSQDLGGFLTLVQSMERSVFTCLVVLWYRSTSVLKPGRRCMVDDYCPTL